LSSSEEETPRKGVKKKKKKKAKKNSGPEAFKKAKNGTAGSEEESERIAKLRAERAGKRGRPPTTGEYVQLAAAKKAVNDERERERRLERETRTYEMEEENLAHNPTGDIASRIREAQAEVVRISKVSSNLKGDLQRALRASASLTLGVIEVLRTRADVMTKKTGQEEVRAMKERLEQLSKAQEEGDTKLRNLAAELDATRTAVREEKSQEGERPETTKGHKPQERGAQSQAS